MENCSFDKESEKTRALKEEKILAFKRRRRNICIGCGSVIMILFIMSILIVTLVVYKEKPLPPSPPPSNDLDDGSEDFAGPLEGHQLCCHAHVRLHCRMWVESEPGKGTNVTWKIPVTLA